VGESLRRAEDKMLGMRDKADAMDALMQQGVINDPLDNRSRTEKELAALRDAHAVDAELEALKQQIGLAAPASAPALGAPKSDHKTEG
jgi:phage shock protein A